MPVSSSSSIVHWLDWGPEAFARADAEGKPVLLSITAPWCHGCAVMDRVSYADAGIAATIMHRLVPVRVNADARPDVNDRYNLEGWPTTVFLTASGEMLTGTTYLPPQQLAALVVDVADAYAQGRDDLDRRASAMAASRRARPGALPLAMEPDLDAPAWIARRIVAECDAVSGGFGAGGKFLHGTALLAGILQYEREPDPALAAALGKTLDGMAEGAIHDRLGGGFFRYASSRDWSKPHTEKMLEDQVVLARAYLEAARVFDAARWRDVALDVLHFVETTLADPAEAAFFSSQAADEAFYQLGSASLRRTVPAPEIDRARYTDWTAQAASTWLRASALLGGVARGELAGRALDAVLVATYQPGDGVAHGPEGSARVRGLLTDQVHAAAALLDLHDATANPTWSMMAEELMRTALRTLWDSQTGGFHDRAPEAPDAIGLLRDPRKPLVPNCLAARVLARLSRLTGDTGLQERALETLRAQTPTYREMGLFGAPYALAVMEMF